MPADMAGTYKDFFKQLKKYKASLDGLDTLDGEKVDTPKVELDKLNALRGSHHASRGGTTRGHGRYQRGPHQLYAGARDELLLGELFARGSDQQHVPPGLGVRL